MTCASPAAHVDPVICCSLIGVLVSSGCSGLEQTKSVGCSSMCQGLADATHAGAAWPADGSQSAGLEALARVLVSWMPNASQTRTPALHGRTQLDLT